MSTTTDNPELLRKALVSRRYYHDLLDTMVAVHGDKTQAELNEFVRKAFSGMSKDDPKWKAFNLLLESAIRLEHFNVRSARNNDEVNNCLGRETSLEDFQGMLNEQWVMAQRQSAPQ